MRAKSLLPGALLSVVLTAFVCPQSPVYALAEQANSSYLLGPGDVLSIHTREGIQPILVSPDGTVVTQFTGVIQAAGKTLQELGDCVNEGAKRWYVNPDFELTLAKRRPVQVYLLGEVVQPGIYCSGDSQDAEVKGNSGAVLTVSGALQMAGGLKETADVRHVHITRLTPKQTFQVDLGHVIMAGDMSQDTTLQAGDVVYVPRAGVDSKDNNLGKINNNKPKVRVMGAVKMPGLIAIEPDDDIVSVIAKAGGFETYAATKSLLLARTNSDGTVTTEAINLKAGLRNHAPVRKKVLAGDVIIVKASTDVASRNLPIGRPSKQTGVPVGDFESSERLKQIAR